MTSVRETWWRFGRVDAFPPKGHEFDFRSSRHVATCTLGKSFTHSCWVVRFSMFEFEFSPDFCGGYENYPFLESLWHRQSEKQCFHLPRVQYGRHLGLGANGNIV